MTNYKKAIEKILGKQQESSFACSMRLGQLNSYGLVTKLGRFVIREAANAI